VVVIKLELIRQTTELFDVQHVPGGFTSLFLADKAKPAARCSGDGRVLGERSSRQGG
jgi:hypothetical protein